MRNITRNTNRHTAATSSCKANMNMFLQQCNQLASSFGWADCDDEDVGIILVFPTGELAMHIEMGTSNNQN